VLSVDDFYLPHSAQRALAAAHPHNRLIQHRGEPGTHDVPLARAVFSALRAGRPARIPRYDKAAHGGQGDRTDAATWEEVNAVSDNVGSSNNNDSEGGGSSTGVIRLVIFEGWCVGFRALPDAEVRARWLRAQAERKAESRLWRHALDELLFVNAALREYNVLME
jgi:D-glycerate 3-kinase